jgi:anti-anti-sigma factor
MDYSFSESGDQLTIRLSWRLTLVDNGKFRGLLEEIKNRKPSACQVDLSPLEFMDSAGLGMFVLLKKYTEQAKCRVKLSKPGGQVKTILELSDFHEVIEIAY